MGALPGEVQAEKFGGQGFAFFKTIGADRLGAMRHNPLNAQSGDQLNTGFILEGVILDHRSNVETGAGMQCFDDLVHGELNAAPFWVPF